MIRKIIALVLSFIIIMICVLPTRATAIVNPSFIYSGMFAYLLSAGYQFNSSDAEEQDVIDMMESLYTEYYESNNSALAVSSYEQGMTVTSLGQFAFNYAILQPLQDFADWIQSNFSITEGDTNYTSIFQGEEIELVDPKNPNLYPLYQDGIVSFPIQTGTVYYTAGSTRTVYEQIGGSNDAVIVPFWNRDKSAGLILFCGKESTCQYRVLTQSLNTDSQQWETTAINYESLSNTATFNDKTFFCNALGRSQGSRLDGYINILNATSFGSSLNTNLRNQIGYAVLFDREVGLTSSLGARIASDLVDRASQVGVGESLLVDVGMEEGSTQADAVTYIGEGIATGSIAAEVPVTTVVSDEVIDTPVQQYPDFDSLGLPDLGLALVTRFPFCIPWDFVDTIKILSADPRPINMDVQIIPTRITNYLGISTDSCTIHIDLSQEQYQRIGIICRWTTLISFIFALTLLTKRMIWTA